VYSRQILDALCYLDQNRITHRDLKPQNILILNDVIKICDFGFARKLSASTTFMNSLKGTPLYIAP
jgi:fused-like protein